MSMLYLGDPKSSDVKIGKLLKRFETKVKAYPSGTCPLTVQLSLLTASKTRPAENVFHAVTGFRSLKLCFAVY